MPQINEYNSQVDAQGAVGGVTPNLEAVSLFGRGVEHVGQALDQASDVLHRRTAQAETSEVFGQMAQARALWSTKLKERLKNGTLDTDQFDQEYGDYVNKIGDQLTTAEGKDFFNKSANRLGGTLMQNAITGQAQIAGQKAFDDINNGIKTNSSTLMEHPDQFADIYDQTSHYIQTKQDAGVITQAQANKMHELLMPELAKGALRGWMTKDPGPGNDNVAKQLLDHGKFDDYLNSDQKKQMYAEARQQDNIRRIDSDNDMVQKNRALSAQGQDYMDQNANRILNGNYSLKEMQSAPLTFQQKEYIQGKVKAQIKGEVATDPIRYNDVYGKIINDEYTTRDQIADEFNKGGLSPDDADKLQRKVDNTPDGVRLRQQMKSTDKAIQALNFKFAGVQTQAGAQAAYAAKQEMDAQEDLYVNSGKGTKQDFYMNQAPNAPTNPINIVGKFRVNAMDQIRQGAAEQTARTTGQGTQGAVKYSTSPTKEIPVQQAPAQGPPQEAPPPQAAAPKEPGMFDRMSDNKGGGDIQDIQQQLGLNNEAGKEADAKREAQRAKERAILGVKAPQANPADNLIRPGEPLADYLKRINKR